MEAFLWVYNAANQPVPLRLDARGKLPTAIPAGPLANRSGTIVSGGVAQLLMPANLGRRYLLIQNPIVAGIANHELWVNDQGEASPAPPSLQIFPGDRYEPAFVTTAAISVFGAVTGAAWSAREG